MSSAHVVGCLLDTKRVNWGFELLESRRLLTTTSWGIDAIDAPAVWDQGYFGQGIVVAVIDSGIDAHVDLVSNIWVNRGETLNNRDDDANGYVDDLNGWNFVEDYYHPISTNHHGTHISGTIAAQRNNFGTTGVAYQAKIMPLRVFNELGEGSTSDIADAIRYAVDNGADIVNLSIGGVATRSVTLALEYANQNNVLVVAASGNAGAETPIFPAVHSATLENIISVGSHNQAFEIAGTSNRVGSSGAVQVDAPGVSIESTVASNEYEYSSGTSVAAAHVAGIAALALSAHPNIPVGELRAAIVKGATRRVEGADSRGAVNAKRTVDIVLQNAGTPLLRADFDGNRVVGFDDFLVIARNFGARNVGFSQGDVNGDGVVAFGDFLVLAQTFGNTDNRRRARDQATETIAAEAAPTPTVAAGLVSSVVVAKPTAAQVDAAIVAIDEEGGTTNESSSLFSLFASSY